MRNSVSWVQDMCSAPPPAVHRTCQRDWTPRLWRGWFVVFLLLAAGVTGICVANSSIGLDEMGGWITDDPSKQAAAIVYALMVPVVLGGGCLGVLHSHAELHSLHFEKWSSARGVSFSCIRKFAHGVQESGTCYE